MVKTKHSARKGPPSGSSRPSHRGDSDDSQKRARPRKRVPLPRHSPSEDSSEDSDYEDELAHMERGEHVPIRTTPPKPGTRRPTFKPPPPPVQPHGDAHHISLVPPLPHGRHAKQFNEVPIASYLKLHHDVDKFTVARDCRDNVFALMFKLTFLPLSSFLRVFLCICALI